MIAALFVRPRSVYKTIPGVDCFDLARNALSFSAKIPCIAHPPCRIWGRYHHLAKPVLGEKHLARFAVHKVRANGGVLEHPSGSKLWRECALPRPGDKPDMFGGYTLGINQCDFGHRAKKPTWLYIVGTCHIPPLPPPAGYSVPVENMGRAERERTPEKLAKYLVQIAQAI